MSEEQGQEPTVQDSTTGAEDVQAQALLADAAADEPAPEGQAPKTFDEAYVAKLREEAAANRVKAKEVEQRLGEEQQASQARMDAIAKALGLKDDDAPPDPEELTRQLTSAQEDATAQAAKLRALETERAAERAARRHRGDADALLDSRDFARKLAKLDPTSDDFTTSLDELVRTEVETNPRYRAASPAPASSGGDFSGGSGDKPGPDTVDDFRKLRKDMWT